MVYVVAVRFSKSQMFYFYGKFSNKFHFKLNDFDDFLKYIS